MGPLVLPQHLLNLDSSPSPMELLFQLMSPLLLLPELTIWLPRVSSMEEFMQLLQLLLLQLCPMPLLQFLMLLHQSVMLLLQFLMVMLQLMATLVPSTSTLSSLLTPMALLSQLMNQLLPLPELTILPSRDKLMLMLQLLMLLLPQLLPLQLSLPPLLPPQPLLLTTTAMLVP